MTIPQYLVLRIEGSTDKLALYYETGLYLYFKEMDKYIKMPSFLLKDTIERIALKNRAFDKELNNRRYVETI